MIYSKKLEKLEITTKKFSENLEAKCTLKIKIKVVKKKMKKLLVSLSLLLMLTSCATPTVVNVIGPNDNKLNCEELSLEIAKANKYADEAQGAKKMSSPHNIASILFFLPAAGVTMKNVEEAVAAAKERSLHLSKLKEKKNC